MDLKDYMIKNIAALNMPMPSIGSAFISQNSKLPDDFLKNSVLAKAPEQPASLDDLRIASEAEHLPQFYRASRLVRGWLAEETPNISKINKHLAENKIDKDNLKKFMKLQDAGIIKTPARWGSPEQGAAALSGLTLGLYKNINPSMRQRFNELEDKYAAQYPWFNAGTQIVASLPTFKGIGTVASKIGLVGKFLSKPAQTLGSKILKGAGIGGGIGGTWGALDAFNRGDSKGNVVSGENLTNTAISGGLGTVAGAGIGGALPVAGAALKNTVDFFRPSARFNKFRNKIGDDVINKALDHNESIIENANEAALQEAQGLRVRGGRNVRQTFADFENRLEKGQEKKVEGLIGKYVSDADYAKRYADLHKNTSKTIEPLYADTVGQGKKVKLGNLEENSIFQDRAKKVRAPSKSDELRHLQTDDLRVLQRITQEIDGEIDKLVTKEGGYKKAEMAELLKLKTQINNTIDEQLADYGIARGTFAKMKAKQDVMKSGNRGFDRLRIEDEPEALLEIAGNTKDYKTGIAQMLRNRNLSTQQENHNRFARVFQKDDLARMKRMGLINDADYNALLADVDRYSKAMKNVYRVTGNSQTAEKGAAAELGVTPGRAIVSPVRSVKRGLGNAIDSAWNKAVSIGDDKLAQYLTDPVALEKAMVKYGGGINRGLTAIDDKMMARLAANLEGGKDNKFYRFIENNRNFVESKPVSNLSPEQYVKQKFGVQDLNTYLKVKTPAGKVTVRPKSIQDHIIQHKTDASRNKYVPEMFATLERPNQIIKGEDGKKYFTKVFYDTSFKPHLNVVSPNKMGDVFSSSYRIGRGGIVDMPIKTNGQVIFDSSAMKPFGFTTAGQWPPRSRSVAQNPNFVNILAGMIGKNWGRKD